MARILGHPDLAQRFPDAPSRGANADEIDQLISSWAAGKDANTACEMLQDAGIAAAPALEADGVVNHP